MHVTLVVHNRVPVMEIANNCARPSGVETSGIEPKPFDKGVQQVGGLLDGAAVAPKTEDQAGIIRAAQGLRSRRSCRCYTVLRRPTGTLA